MRAIKRLVKKEGPVVVAGRTFIATYWVGLGEPEPGGDDLTCPEVTGKYLTKRALLAAIEKGEEPK